MSSGLSAAVNRAETREFSAAVSRDVNAKLNGAANRVANCAVTSAFSRELSSGLNRALSLRFSSALSAAVNTAVPARVLRLAAGLARKLSQYREMFIGEPHSLGKAAAPLPQSKDLAGIHM